MYKQPKLWEFFSEEQIRDFYEKATSRADFLSMLGYKCYRKCVIEDIQKTYPFVDFSHCTAGVFQDITGKRFGRLTVLRKDTSRNDHDLYWICKCDCGNEVSVRGTNLRRGIAKSCGCLLTESRYNKIEDLTGRKFGHWTVLGRDPNETKRVKYFCQCDCGNTEIRSVYAEHLRSGDSTSCGCVSSKGEEKVGKLLSEMGISFKKEYTFDDLMGEGRPLRFDFAIFQDNFLCCLIEYQGEQHYSAKRQWGDMSKYDGVVARDEKKRNYCEDNGIPLIEICYKDFNNLNKDYLLNRLKEAGYNV